MWTPLQILPMNVRDLGKLIVAKGFKKLPEVQLIAKSGQTALKKPFSVTLRSIFGQERMQTKSSILDGGL